MQNLTQKKAARKILSIYLFLNVELKKDDDLSLVIISLSLQDDGVDGSDGALVILLLPVAEDLFPPTSLEKKGKEKKGNSEEKPRDLPNSCSCSFSVFFTISLFPALVPSFL